MLTLAVLLAAAVVAALGTWATFRLLGRLALDPIERLALVLALYPAALGLAAFAGLLVGRPGVPLPLALTLLLVPLGWWAGRRAQPYPYPATVGHGVATRSAQSEELPLGAALQALALFALGTLGTVLVAPVSGGALRIGDWVAHWFLVLVYLGQPLPDLRVFVNRVGDFGVVSRPPLYNLEGGLLVGPLDDQFWPFQLTGALLGIPIVAAAVLWARNIGGAAAARAIVPLCALSPFLIQNTAYPWPKMVAALLVLLFLYFIRAATVSRDPSRRRQTFILAAACAGLGYLAHQTAVFYVLPTLLWLVWRRPRTLFAGPRTRTVLTWAAAGLAGALLVAPWQLWVVATYGLRATVEANPAWFGADETETLADWLLKGGVAALGTLIPLPALGALARGTAPSIDQLLRIQLALLTGALGLSGCAVLAHTACRRVGAIEQAVRRRDGAEVNSAGIPSLRSGQALSAAKDLRTENDRRSFAVPRMTAWRRSIRSLRRPPLLALVAFSGFAGQVMLQPNWHTTGDAAESMTPIVVLGLAYVARGLGGLRPGARHLFCAAVVAEALLFHVLYAWWAFGPAWARDPNTVLAARYGLTHLRSLAPALGPLGAAMLATAVATATLMLWRESGRRARPAPIPVLEPATYGATSGTVGTS